MLIVALFLILGFFVLSQIRVLAVTRMASNLRRRKPTLPTRQPNPAMDDTWPLVVAQLPVYQEHKVLNRLLSSVLKMKYPQRRIVVQVLDDSEEHEAEFAATIVGRYQSGPIRVEYLHRPHRTGYKSGALNYGIRGTHCELLVIFDADFIPNPDFLQKTVPLFQDERVGAVHTRWKHLNDFESPLTMLQAAVLDTLFYFENELKQSMHESSMYLGTSGVWRKKTLDELGGWREAPFTDDGIDLSYRAQLAGWFVAFVSDPLSSSELPNTYLSYKSQQRRWARAALRLFLDYWSHAFDSPRPLRSRLLEVSLLHLVLSTPCLVFAAMLSGLYVGLGLPRSTSWVTAQIGLMAIVAVFPPAQEVLLSQRMLYDDWKNRCLLAIRGFPLAIGLSLSILAGFCDTFRDSKIEFVRTPKQGSDAVIQSSRRRWIESAAVIAGLEIVIATLTLIALIIAIVRGYPESMFLLLLVSSAFFISGWTSWREISRS